MYSGGWRFAAEMVKGRPSFDSTTTWPLSGLPVTQLKICGMVLIGRATWALIETFDDSRYPSNKNVTDEVIGLGFDLALSYAVSETDSPGGMTVPARSSKVVQVQLGFTSVIFSGSAPMLRT